MNDILAFIKANIDTISAVVTLLFLLSETLAQIPAIKANSVFQLITLLLAKAKELLPVKKTDPTNPPPTNPVPPTTGG